MEGLFVKAKILAGNGTKRRKASFIEGEISTALQNIKSEMFSQLCNENKVSVEVCFNNPFVKDERQETLPFGDKV